MQRQAIAATLLAALLLVSALLLAGQSVRAQDKDEKGDRRTIQSTGQGVVKIRPDHARVFFAVQTFAPTVKQARNQNATQTRQVTNALGALKIPGLKMKSTNLTVELINVDGEGRVPKVAGYRVTNSFTALVSSAEPDKLGPLAGKVLDVALENGANNVEQIVFFKEDDEPARRQALSLAVRNARANAEAMASGADRRVIGVISIAGQPEYGLGGMAQSSNAAINNFSGQGTSLMAGELEISCTVNVICSF